MSQNPGKITDSARNELDLNCCLYLERCSSSLDNWDIQVWVPPTHSPHHRTRNRFASQDNLFQDQASAGYASHTAGVRPVLTLLEHVIPLWSLTVFADFPGNEWVFHSAISMPQTGLHLLELSSLSLNGGREIVIWKRLHAIRCSGSGGIIDTWAVRWLMDWFYGHDWRQMQVARAGWSTSPGESL